MAYRPSIIATHAVFYLYYLYRSLHPPCYVHDNLGNLIALMRIITLCSEVNRAHHFDFSTIESRIEAIQYQQTEK